MAQIHFILVICESTYHPRWSESFLDAGTLRHSVSSKKFLLDEEKLGNSIELSQSLTKIERSKDNLKWCRIIQVQKDF